MFFLFVHIMNYKKLDFSTRLSVLPRKGIVVERPPYGYTHLGCSLLKTHYQERLGFNHALILQLFSTFATMQLVVSNHCLGL